MVKRPEGISDELFLDLLEKATNWDYWEHEPWKEIKDEWWNKIFELNKTNRFVERIFDD